MKYKMIQDMREDVNIILYNKHSIINKCIIIITRQYIHCKIHDCMKNIYFTLRNVNLGLDTKYI